jgi:hypothetical protein
MKLSYKKSIVDCILNLIAKNACCLLEEAAECIQNILSSKFKNVFADIAMKKDIAIDGKQRKMDIVSIEAMLSEAQIGTYSA